MLFDLERPEQVTPFHAPGAPWLERNPLLVFKIISALLFLLCFYLLVKLWTAGVHLP
jgi:hypothetical protein